MFALFKIILAVQNLSDSNDQLRVYEEGYLNFSSSVIIDMKTIDNLIKWCDEEERITSHLLEEQSYSKSHTTDEYTNFIEFVSKEVDYSLELYLSAIYRSEQKESRRT